MSRVARFGLPRAVPAWIATVVVALVPLGASAAPARAQDGPMQRSIVAALAHSAKHDGGSLDPPGANRWGCRPSAAHPRPVVLVHGTGANAYDDFAYLSPKLVSAGVCVFALNYSTKRLPLGPGFFGLGPIAESAKELGPYVDRVLAATGASQVDLVGHSQGGMMPRAYLKSGGGTDPADPSRNKVHAMISLGATNGGTTLSGLATLVQELGAERRFAALLGQAGVDQFVGSPFLTDLNAGGMTQRGVIYTAIVTKYDEVTTPVRSGWITGNEAGAEVHNIELQGSCWTNFADHLSLPYSARTLWYVKAALGLPRSSRPTCDVQLPLF